MGEAEEFRDFVRDRRRSLLQTAWMLTGDWHTAEDLVQAALARCYPHWSRVSAGSPEAYVRRTIVNLHASWWRRRWRGEVPTAHPSQVAASGDEYGAVDQRDALVTALRHLGPRQRATVVLRYYLDLSEAETAAALGCSIGTVKSQTAKALATLRSSGALLDVDGQSEARDD